MENKIEGTYSTLDEETRKKKQRKHKLVKEKSTRRWIHERESTRERERKHWHGWEKHEITHSQVIPPCQVDNLIGSRGKSRPHMGPALYSAVHVPWVG